MTSNEWTKTQKRYQLNIDIVTSCRCLSFYDIWSAQFEQYNIKLVNNKYGSDEKCS